MRRRLALRAEACASTSVDEDERDIPEIIEAIGVFKSNPQLLSNYEVRLIALRRVSSLKHHIHITFIYHVQDVHILHSLIKRQNKKLLSILIHGIF